MSQDALQPQQFGAFTRAHAKGSVAAQMAASGGGLTRDQPVARLAQSKPYPAIMGRQGPSSMLDLVEKLAPGMLTLRQRTRPLN